MTQCLILTHNLHHSMAQEGTAALEIAKAFDVQRPDTGTWISVSYPLCQISMENRWNTITVWTSLTQEEKQTVLLLSYLPAPPANDRPDEFMPASTKYPYMPGVSPIRQRMSGVKDSGQFTSCWISLVSRLGILRNKALNMGSVLISKES